MILFGLFHGLAFLPVVLSLVGPETYSHIQKKEEEGTKDVKESMLMTRNNEVLSNLPNLNETTV